MHVIYKMYQALSVLSGERLGTRLGYRQVEGFTLAGNHVDYRCSWFYQASVSPILNRSKLTNI